MVQDPTLSKGVWFSCTTIPKNIKYGCKLSQTQQPYTLGSYPAIFLVKIYRWGLCFVFLELLGDPTRWLTMGYWVLLKLGPNNVGSSSTL